MRLEIWMPVVGYEGLYEVSDHGAIRSLSRVSERNSRWGRYERTITGKTMALMTSPNGYQQIALYNDGKMKRFNVHRVVMAAFVGPNALPINHIDGDKLNNVLSNLEYCTHKENTHHMIHVLGKGQRGEQVSNARLNEEAVRDIRKELLTVQQYAEKYSVTRQAISLVKNGRNWKHVK
jgi:hypothetical protein